MKNILTCLLAICCCTMMYAQDLNITLLDQVQYDAEGNDVWGYVAPDGTEYALMGLFTGTSIVSLADPTNAAEVARIPGANSTWRDLKTWDNHAYVSNETVGTIAIIDLNNLPTDAPFNDTQLEFNGTPIGNIHNLYIDEFGYLYVAGSDLNAGGVIIYDLNNDPKNPVFVGSGPAVYAHDIYVRDNIMYTSDVYDGVFRVHDVSDKSNTTVLGSQSTPFNFTHNAWLSDDSKTLFTTDETGDAYTAAYDISDLTDIKELDRFRPAATEGNSVIPHNVHVKDDFLVISHYTDGIIIVDANKPDNLVEVGNYDTYIGPHGGFNGCWGAYPFLPSGIILASNFTGVDGSLDVLMPTYVRACYLEGKITDADTGGNIFDANINFTTVSANANSDFSGNYGTGYPTAGTYEITVSHPAYISQTVSVSLTNEEVTMQDVALMPKPSYSFTGQVVNATTNAPIEGAVVYMTSPSADYDLMTDGSGNFSGTIIGDTYEIYAGKWGFNTKLVSGEVIDGPGMSTIALDEGIKDEFILDLGWTVTNTPFNNDFKGEWVREEPIETGFGNFVLNPGADIPDDLGTYCYMTGNVDDAIGSNLDNGMTTLTSPPMDMSTMQNPTISYYTWFVNINQGPSNDAFTIKITDGTTTMLIDSMTTSSQQWSPKTVVSVKDYFPNPTANMQVIFETADYAPFDVVEAAVDLFEAYDNLVGIENTIDENIDLTAFPNPFDSELTINYTLDDLDDNTALEVRNTLGQLVYRADIGVRQGTHTINTSLEAGIYFVQITNGKALSVPVKVFKQ